MRKLATIREIRKTESIPNADNIELIFVDGWQLISKKNEFKAGELCVFFEIDSILPKHDLFDFMVPRKMRVKTIKCMKQISQGLALPISILTQFNHSGQVSLGDDVTDVIGVVKHDPEAARERKFNTSPVSKKWYKRILARLPIIGKFFRGSAGRLSFPTDLCSKTDEERYQNLSNTMKEEFLNKVIGITEKIDGTSTTFIYKPVSWFKSWFVESFMVCSRNFQLAKPDNSWWWSIARKLDVQKKLELIHKELRLSSNQYIILQGETIGTDIQKNKYKVNDYDFYAFNMEVDRKVLSYDTMNAILDQHGIKTVPLLISMVFETVEQLEEFVTNPNENSVVCDRIAEGRVYRIESETHSIDSFKFINPKFLLKLKDDE